MNDRNTSLKRDIEELLNKTIEANKVFVSESTSLLQKMGEQKGSATKVNFFQNDFLSKALNAYTSLNIQHAKNMLDLGISLPRSINTTESESSSDSQDCDTEIAPAFILSATANVGSRVTLQFIVDNYKKEEVTCEFVRSPYLSQQNASNAKDFQTAFSPSTFLIAPGASQTVMIEIAIAKNTVPGLYISQVQIKGFEPAFFSIQVTIN